MKIINRKCPNQLIKPKLINIFSDEFRMVSFTNIKNSLQPTNGLLQLILENSLPPTLNRFYIPAPPARTESMCNYQQMKNNRCAAPL